MNSLIKSSLSVTPIVIVQEKHYADWLASQPDMTQHWLNNNGFDCKKGTVLPIPGAEGEIVQVIIGLMHDDDVWALARAATPLKSVLPAGDYQLTDMPFYAEYPCMHSPLFYLAWGFEQYRFTPYKSGLAKSLCRKSLVIPEHQDVEMLQKILTVICRVRDLINIPAQDLNPVTLEETVRHLADTYQATFRAIIGEDLLTENFPAIHAVGRASVFAPRLLEFHWGDPTMPHVTLVGKGVCFDTGGLNIKPGTSMALMRKDMSGAAQVLGVASLIMEMNLPVYLQVLIPTVENSIGGNAYRPGDIVTTRQGLTVTIDNTDAEGRMILADALTYAMESPPDLLVDIASLTGISMMTFGYDIASFFTNDDQCAAALMVAAQRVNEPLWRMPLYAPYQSFISPETTDLTNAAPQGYAGSITAALFLQMFAQTKSFPQTTWLHYDTSAWNDKPKPGQPVGGEATVVRSLYDYIATRFSLK